jgi:group II intron reverse transcriptase/maturase
VLADRTIRALEGISKASRSGARAKKLHKIMRVSEDLWLHAYARIQANRGAITPGVTGNTLDGFGRERVLALMASLREGTYRPSPVRRTYILKDPTNPAGKKRPLGIPTGDDKLVQEVARILLEAIYEPVFSDRSHGFRPGRSCHTALTQIVDSWKGTKWVCELDIKGYFDNIDHEVLLTVLEKRIDDRAFLDLIRLFLRAGYLEDWKYHATYSGTPQGGVVSPILANIYLHELDEHMEGAIAAFNKGHRRKPNKAYRALVEPISRRRRFLREHGETHPDAGAVLAELAELGERQRSMPSVDMHDPGFKRLHYVRYADDFLVGIVGTKEDAIRTMEEVKTFVEGTLKLTISTEKSRLAALEDGVEFLGYGVTSRRMDKRMKCVVGRAEDRVVHAVKRTITSHIHLSVPTERVRTFAQQRGYGTYDAGPNDIRARFPLLAQSDFEIVSQFNSELRGFANYYALAPKYYLNHLEWMAHTSLYKTLGRKHDEEWAKVFRRMWTKNGRALAYNQDGKSGLLRVFRLKDRAKPDRRHSPDQLPNLFQYAGRSELLRRLLAEKCEACGTEEAPFEVHHVRKLADVAKNITRWDRLMVERRRKTLVLCRPCHVDLHRGTLPDRRYADH